MKKSDSVTKHTTAPSNVQLSPATYSASAPSWDFEFDPGFDLEFDLGVGREGHRPGLSASA